LRSEALEAEFTKIWGGLTEVERDTYPESPPNGDQPNKQSRTRSAGRRQGLVVDSLVRRAIERRAVALATEHYEAAGYAVEDTGLYESFDLRCALEGEELRVEVKGTTGLGERVNVTANEVVHAKSGVTRVDLFIVTRIQVLRSPEGPQAVGGEVRILSNWVPRDEDLQPASFYYAVPETW
jgi:hypothetical protein